MAELPASAPKRCNIAEGGQAPRIYEFPEFTVWFSDEGLPAEAPGRLLLMCGVGQDAELEFWRSEARTVRGCLLELRRWDEPTIRYWSNRR